VGLATVAASIAHVVKRSQTSAQVLWTLSAATWMVGGGVTLYELAVLAFFAAAGSVQLPVEVGALDTSGVALIATAVAAPGAIIGERRRRNFG
jgi:hypothetical protein